MPRITLISESAIDAEISGETVLTLPLVEESTGRTDRLSDETLFGTSGAYYARLFDRHSILEEAEVARRTEHTACLVSVHELAFRT